MKTTATHTYHVTIEGSLDEDFVNSFCPPGTTRRCENGATILANISADQSAIIGLLRNLHNLGCTIVELAIEKETV